MLSFLTSNSKPDFDRDLEKFSKDAQESVELASQNGFTINLDEWLTVKRYAERYGVSTQVVTNWITRGVIPADCTITVPELNDMRLVKNQPYYQA